MRTQKEIQEMVKKRNITMKTRRFFLKSIGLGAVALTFAPSLRAKEQSLKRPNIVFIMSDDHASHAISAYGSKINRTPQIDQQHLFTKPSGYLDWQV